jgi:hypothetical protein
MVISLTTAKFKPLIIRVDFEVIHQLVIINSPFVRHWRKNGIYWDSTSVIYRFQEGL